MVWTVRSLWTALRVVVASMAIGVAMGGCGSRGLSGAQRAGIQQAVARWAAAGTPQQACVLMSGGFRSFVGRGNPFDCARYFVATLGAPAPARIAVAQIAMRSGQALVRATIVTPNTNRGGVATPVITHRMSMTLYYVHQRGAWRLNSIGVRKGVGSPAPGARGNAAGPQGP